MPLRNVILSNIIGDNLLRFYIPIGEEDVSEWHLTLILQRDRYFESIKGIIAGLISSEVPTIASFLRKNQRPLRVSSLNLLGSLIQNGLTNCDDVLVELPQLINEQDLHVAQLGKT